MGIKNLNKFLRNNYPEVFQQVHISEYSFKKVAIDISLYMCKFKSVYGESWLPAFLNLVACLRKNDVHCVFVYDSGAPIEKDVEKKKRSDQRERMRFRVDSLEDALEKFHLSQEIDPVLIEFHEKRSKAPRRFLQKNRQIDMKFVENEIQKMRSHMLEITPHDFTLTKKLFDILRVPYFNAPMEAETTCADLCRRGLVDAVLSEDSDILAYGSPICLSKLNTSEGTVFRINYAQMLEKLELTEAEFLDFCIACGTDYNTNIPRIGAEKAFKHIKAFRTIEGIRDEGKLDVSILNHERGRDLFRNYTQISIDIPYCGTPDYKALAEFFTAKKIRIDPEAFRESFSVNTCVVFEDEKK